MEKSQPRSSLVVEDVPNSNSEQDSEEYLEAKPLKRGSLLGSDVWAEGIYSKTKKSKKVRFYVMYFVVGILSFLLFLYLSFPFNVVKEVLVGKVNDSFVQSKVPVRMTVGNFRPKFPLGLYFEDVQLNNVNDPLASIKIGKASVSLSVLSLFLGNISSDLRIEQSGGSVEIETTHSIRGLLASASSKVLKLPPGDLVIDFNRFELKPLIASALGYVRSGNNPALQTIQPFLRTEVSGLLSGKIKLQVPIAADSFDKVNSDVDLTILQAYFEMKDETLAIPIQDFSEARIKLKLNKKSIEIPNETRLIANDIGINLSGRMSVSERMDITDVKLNLGLVLKGKIEENFKTLIPVILGWDLGKMSGGKMDVELSGNFSALTCQ